MATILVPSDGKFGTPDLPIRYARLTNPVRQTSPSCALRFPFPSPSRFL